MKPLVYISSPYTKGDQALNARFQCKIWDLLARSGLVVPIAPLWSHFQHTVFPRPYEFWLEYDLDLIRSADFAACLRLDAECPGLGYVQRESSGADKEVALFKELDIPVFYSVPDLLAYVINRN